MSPRRPKMLLLSSLFACEPPSSELRSAEAAAREGSPTLTVACADPDCLSLIATLPDDATDPRWVWGGRPLDLRDLAIELDSPVDEAGVLEADWTSSAGHESARLGVMGAGFGPLEVERLVSITIVPMGAMCAQAPVVHLGGCLKAGQILTATVSLPGLAADPIAQLDTMVDPISLVTFDIPWARFAVDGEIGTVDLSGAAWSPGMLGAPSAPTWIGGDNLAYWLALPSGLTTIDLQHATGGMADVKSQITCQDGEIVSVQTTFK